MAKETDMIEEIKRVITLLKEEVTIKEIEYDEKKRGIHIKVIRRGE